MSAAKVQSSTDEVRVPIKAWLPGSTYRALRQIADQMHTDVGQLLVLLAQQSVHQRTNTGRKAYVRMTPQRLNRMVEMWKAGHHYTAIARELGCSQSSVYQHLKRLALTPRRPS